jgi:hypothetical protein
MGRNMDSRAAYLDRNEVWNRLKTSTSCCSDLLANMRGRLRRGFGTFLTLQFGGPHRDIREPIQASENASATVKRTLAADEFRLREIFLCGSWTRGGRFPTRTWRSIGRQMRLL